MWYMIWPILFIVGSNTFYNIAAKSTSESVNSFASLSVSYGVGMIVSFILFLITSTDKNIIHELKKANWATIVLGITIVGLEFGFICAYRAGWQISITQVVSSIGVACVLVIVGALFYKEKLDLKKIFGLIVSFCGMYLLMK